MNLDPTVNFRLNITRLSFYWSPKARAFDGPVCLVVFRDGLGMTLLVGPDGFWQILTKTRWLNERREVSS